MPAKVVAKCTEALNSHQKSVNGSKILVIGLAYKPNVDDDRESPSYELMTRLRDLGATVDYHDPHIPVIRPSREHSAWAGTTSVPWDQPTIAGYDLTLISTWHDGLDAEQLVKWSPCVVDTRNATAEVASQLRTAKVFPA